MDAYSLDLRLSIVRACAQWPETREEIAGLFGVSRSFVQKLLRCWNAGLGIAPKPYRRGPAPLLDAGARSCLREVLQSRPEASLAELCRELKRQQRLSTSPATVCRALQDLNLPVKKSRFTPTNGILRGSGRYGVGGGERLPRPRSSISSSSMKAERIRR
jgi:transposase